MASRCSAAAHSTGRAWKASRRAASSSSSSSCSRLLAYVGLVRELVINSGDCANGAVQRWFAAVPAVALLLDESVVCGVCCMHLSRGHTLVAGCVCCGRGGQG